VRFVGVLCIVSTCLLGGHYPHGSGWALKMPSPDAYFRPSELMHLTAGLLAKLDSEVSERISTCREEADPDGDIDSQFEEVSDFLDSIRYLVEADSVFQEKHDKLTADLDHAKKDVEARKSDDEEETSFFTSVPRAAVQREQQGGRSIFSDVDE